jgi:aminoglycoside 3-N-acetyltransferase
MSEKDVIKNSSRPWTINTLTDDLKNIGVKKGMTVLVHSSMSSIGWICGGAVPVIMAIERIIGDEGTLIMPAYSGDLSDPAKWENPPVPEQWYGTIRENMPVFYADLTPTRGVGVIPEVFRKQRGVLRSNPGEHNLEYAFGEKSPLAKIYELDGYVLLLGVGHINNTSIHLAEYRADYPSKEEESCGTPLMVSGEREWVDIKDIKTYTEDFEKLGSAFMKEKKELIKISNIGQASSQLFHQRDLVDFAVSWMEANRK